MLLFLLACVSVVDIPEPQPRLSSISAPTLVPIETGRQTPLMQINNDGALLQVWVECYGAGEEVEFTLLDPVVGLIFGAATNNLSCDLMDKRQAYGSSFCPDNYTKSLTQTLPLNEGYADVWVFLDAVPFVLDEGGYVSFFPVDLRVSYGETTAFVSIDVSSLKEE